MKRSRFRVGNANLQDNTTALLLNEEEIIPIIKWVGESAQQCVGRSAHFFCLIFEINWYWSKIFVCLSCDFWI